MGAMRLDLLHRGLLAGVSDVVADRVVGNRIMQQVVTVLHDDPLAVAQDVDVLAVSAAVGRTGDQARPLTVFPVPGRIV
jgi:hypothetical protein